jgi:hypothetical protein
MSHDFKVLFCTKKQTDMVRMDDTETKEETDARTGIAPLNGEPANQNKDIESGDTSTSASPEPSWPLSALFASKKWNTFRTLSIGSARKWSSPDHQHRRSLSPFRTVRAHGRGTSPLSPDGSPDQLRSSSRAAGPNKSRRSKTEVSLKIEPQHCNEESENDKKRSRSPLQRFNLCRAAYYAPDQKDWVTADNEINDRKEFIVVLAASLQKFGAATHLTEAFTDAVAQVCRCLYRARMH